MANKISKSVFVDFIKRYSLGNTIEQAKITCKDGKLSCDFNTLDKSNVGYTSLKDSGLDDFEIGIYTTSELLGLLEFFSNEIEIEFITNSNNECSQMIIKDDINNELTYSLASTSIIDKVPEIDEEPDYETNIIITPNFIGDFIKSSSVLKNCELFTIISTGKKSTKVLMNYNTIKSNTLTFDVETVDNKHFETNKELILRVEFIKQVLATNKAFDEATLSISSEGLAKITVKNGNYKATYFSMLLDSSSIN